MQSSYDLVSVSADGRREGFSLFQPLDQAESLFDVVGRPGNRLGHVVRALYGPEYLDV